MLADLHPIKVFKDQIIYRAALSHQTEPLEFSYIGFIGASHQHYRKLSVVEKALYDFLDCENGYKSSVLFSSKKTYQLLIQERAEWYSIQEIEPSESFVDSRLDHEHIRLNTPSAS